MSYLSDYLTHLRDTRRMGGATDETSHYTALENLLNTVGSGLAPRVIATSQLSLSGTGIAPRGVQARGLPDFGYFVRETQDLRGLVEAKGADQDVRAIMGQRQIRNYLRAVPTVIITTYREFLLVTRGPDGSPVEGPSYSLAETPDAFWDAPLGEIARRHEEGFRAYLELVLQHTGPIVSAEELALVLARYAAEARARIDRQPNAALDPLRTAMVDALGITFSGPKGEAFFRSSLVQTLFYGLFSAWTIWSETSRADGESFAWEDASAYLNVAVIGALYEAVATNRRLRSLDLADPVRWAEDALNRVEHDAFFRTFAQQHAIQYFYEPFLDAYDPDLREQLGVWYTPPEIVRYQVRKVDQLLRDELGIAAGLADDNVVVLDPCTGTGSYLLEVARVIHERFAGDEPALAAMRTKRAVSSRLFAFELLPAPFIIAHLQMARLLTAFGAPLTDSERAKIFLTNALIGWDGAAVARQPGFPEMAEEREAADRVKREERILVILGNPPYYRYATMGVGEEADLIAPYKEGLYRRFKVRKSTLDDLYIRFFRLAEWRIAEQGVHRGIVSYISNWSWLSGSSFPVMRERLLHNFGTIHIDSLGGGVRGRDRRLDQADESIFLTDSSSGIGVGTAITFLVASGGRREEIADVQYRRVYGEAQEKRNLLLRSVADGDVAAPYRVLVPTFEKKWVLRPSGEPGEYDTWASLADLLPTRETGVNENRGGALISVDRIDLEALVHAYMDPANSQQQIADASERGRKLMGQFARYNAGLVRSTLQHAQPANQPRIVSYAVRAFDDRWLLWGGDKLLNEKRTDFLALVDPETVVPEERQIFLVACENARVVYDLPGITPHLGDMHYEDPWAQYFPVRNRTKPTPFVPSVTRPNVDESVFSQLAEAWSVVLTAVDTDASAAEMAIGEAVFYHTLATMHTPVYRTNYEEALSTNWARIPVPLARDLLTESATLGRRVAALLRMDIAVPDIESAAAPSWLRNIARPRHIEHSALIDADLAVTMNYRGAGRVIARHLSDDERVALGDVLDFGERTNDIYWNREAYWSNVPPTVWEFQIGGFPVLRKWLDDRQISKLGRPLNLDEIGTFSRIARRITALLILGSELDECHERVIISPLIAP